MHYGPFQRTLTTRPLTLSAPLFINRRLSFQTTISTRFNTIRPQFELQSKQLFPKPYISLLPTLNIRQNNIFTHQIRLNANNTGNLSPTAQFLKRLSARSRLVRSMTMRGQDSSKHWDPFETKPRDFEMGLSASQQIQQQAKQQREKQLLDWHKLKEKKAKKEQEQRDKLNNVKKKRVPFKTKVSSAGTRLYHFFREPRNYIPSKFFGIEKPENLSFTQKAIYLWWKQTLLIAIASYLLLPQIPFVKERLQQLQNYRNRRKRGVLGLDEYANVEKMDVNLEFVKTGDFSFDVNYLQKMILRDLFVLDRLATQLISSINKRSTLIENLHEAIIRYQKEIDFNGGRFLTLHQREATLSINEWITPLLEEKKDAAKFIEQIEKQWKTVTIPGLRAQTDQKLDGNFISRFLKGDNERHRILSSLITTSQGLIEWKQGLQDEFQRHQERYNTLEELYKRLVLTDKEFDKWISLREKTYMTSMMDEINNEIHDPNYQAKIHQEQRDDGDQIDGIDELRQLYEQQAKLQQPLFDSQPQIQPSQSQQEYPAFDPAQLEALRNSPVPPTADELEASLRNGPLFSPPSQQQQQQQQQVESEQKSLLQFSNLLSSLDPLTYRLDGEDDSLSVELYDPDDPHTYKREDVEYLVQQLLDLGYSVNQESYENVLLFKLDKGEQRNNPRLIPPPQSKNQQYEQQQMQQHLENNDLPISQRVSELHHQPKPSSIPFSVYK